MAFDPNAPYSSSMDDIPLKLLFGVTNSKMRRRASRKTKEIETHSPKIVGDSSDDVNNRLEESLSSPLEIPAIERHKKYAYAESQLDCKVTKKCSGMNLKNVETKHIKLDVATCPNEEEINALKQRRELMQKFSSIRDLVSPMRADLTKKIQREHESTELCCSDTQYGDTPEEYPHKRIKIEKEVRTFKEKAYGNEVKEHFENVHAPSEISNGGSYINYRLQVKQESYDVKEVANLGSGEDSTGIVDNFNFPAECSDHKGSNSYSKQILEEIEPRVATAKVPKLVSIDDDKESLPAIFSLHEYIKSKKEKSNGGAKPDGLQYMSRENQSIDSGKMAALCMEGLAQDQKSNQVNIHSKGMDDVMHKPSLVHAGPDCPRKVNTHHKIVEKYSNVAGSDGVKNTRTGKTVKLSTDEKIWEGCLQMNAYIAVMALGFFKSGTKTRANNWSKFVEVKGRVRLKEFEKFLKELPLSRNRALMVMSIRWKVGSSDAGLPGIQEIINSYKQGERVGFAELAAGVDLYLCPPDVTMIHMLATYGFINNDEHANKKQDDLIGCVVWRRNCTTSNPPKLALPGVLLDSPSNPGVSQWALYGNVGPKTGVSSCLETVSTNANTQRNDKDENRLQITESANQNDTFVRNAKVEIEQKKEEFGQNKAETEQNTAKNATCSVLDSQGWVSYASETDMSPGFSSRLAGLVPHNPQISICKALSQTSLPLADTYSVQTEKVPGECGYNATTAQNDKVVQNHVTDKDEDDDDLPEFDFRVVSGASQMLINQLLPPSSDVQSLPPQLPAQSSTTSCNPVSLPPTVSMISSHCQLGGHKNKERVFQPSIIPHSPMQIRDLIHKFGQAEAFPHFPPVENCGPKVPGPKHPVISGKQSVVFNSTHISTNFQTPCPLGNELRKSLWDDDDMPEWCPPYLEQQGFSGQSVTPVAQLQSAMPKQCSVQPQSGVQTFVRNLPIVYPPSFQAVPNPHSRPCLRGSPPQLPNIPQGPRPPLPLGPPPSVNMIQPIPRPVTKIDTVNMDSCNSATSFQPQHIRPPYCKPDFTPLRPVDRSARRF